MALSANAQWESTRVGRWLLRTPGGRLRYVLEMLATAIIPALAVPLLLDWLGMRPTERSMPVSGARWMVFAVEASVIAPLLETLVMFPVLRVLSWLARDRIKLALLSGMSWGLFHVLFVAPGSWPTGWLFFLLSAILLAWRPISWRKAFGYTATVHALNNATAIALIALPRA